VKIEPGVEGSKNTLKRLDHNIVKLLEVDYLPLIFNGDVIFEFLPIKSSTKASLAKLMVGMDKQHDGHTWTKTITFYIKNDMGLKFYTSSCVGHFYCDN
jgi:hypothetical protein